MRAQRGKIILENSEEAKFINKTLSPLAFLSVTSDFYQKDVLARLIVNLISRGEEL